MTVLVFWRGGLYAQREQRAGAGRVVSSLLLVTVITLKLEPNGDSTNVEVVYERTALAEAANKIVRDMAAGDRVAGKEWSEQINTYLRQRP